MMTNFTTVGRGALLKKKMECQRKNITSDYQGVIRDQTGTAKKGQNFSSVTARPSASVAVVPPDRLRKEDGSGIKHPFESNL